MQICGVHSLGFDWGAVGCELPGRGGGLCGAGGTFQHTIIAAGGTDTHVRRV